MARYFWKNGQFVDRDGNPMDKPFAGQIDELRMFTFNSGEFEVQDLGYYIPEPASLGLVGMAGLALLGRRRNGWA